MENSNISWTTHTFNPWIGCTKVSAGCDNCYAAEQDKMRFSRTLGGGTPKKPVSHWGPKAPRHKTSDANWREPYKWNQRAFMETAGRERPRVFCASLADWLDREILSDWRYQLLRVVMACRDLDWLMLTKRPENWRPLVTAAGSYASQVGDHFTAGKILEWLAGVPPGHVWVGASAENRPRMLHVNEHLRRIPAYVRFYSCEPFLEDMSTGPFEEIDWIILGGESGPGHRPMVMDAFLNTIDAITQADVPIFVKQDSGSRSGLQGRIPDEIYQRKESPRLRKGQITS